jgi:hypothetical protein
MWRDSSLSFIPDSSDLAQWLEDGDDVIDSDVFEPLPFDTTTEQEQLLMDSIESGDFAAFFDKFDDNKLQKSTKSSSSKIGTAQNVTFKAMPSIQRFAAMSA